MSILAIVGGTGLTRMDGLEITRREMVKTPYGAPSCPLLFGELHGQSIVFLARHGSKHSIPAHRINYCANMWALHSVGVSRVLATGVVGGIDEECVPGSMVIPDQVIDYTHDRISTYCDGGPEHDMRQVDFSFPYNEVLRQLLITGCKTASLPYVDHGTYGATSGPRFETVAEIRRLERDGCSIVGLSGMPEAVLARELGLDYALCAVVINPAAGKGDGIIDMNTWDATVDAGMASVQKVLASTLQSLI